MHRARDFAKDTDGDAVVEAAILFPIMIMIFAALVLLAMYLPVRSTLQRATQYAATAIATGKSDAWLIYESGPMRFEWKTEKDNVYFSLFSEKLLTGEDEKKAEEIINHFEKKSLVGPRGKLDVEVGAVNYIVYKEIVVTATRSVSLRGDLFLDLSFVRFPGDLVITATSTAVVQNAEEFIRNVDIIVDAAAYFGLNVGEIGKLFSSVARVFG